MRAAFAVLLPVRRVGVMSDGGSCDRACAPCAGTGTDGMTADVHPFDMAVLSRVAGRDITSKPPGTIEWE